jgi:adrenodoxin-NADP+ reductase
MAHADTPPDPGDTNGTISVAIVGSGPSGCYTAKYLLKAVQDRWSDGPRKISIQTVDVLERLPTPYGLVRYGVAPDHPDVKNVQNDFDRLFEVEQDGSQQPLVRFFGNVHVGVDVSLAELRERYDVVILSYGCQSDRKLHIPGEDQLPGIVSAREFVAWYNGHPYFHHIGETVCRAIVRRNQATQEDGVSVVIVGHGNVAIDCARILAKADPASVGGLYDTDMSLDAWNTLRELNVRNIVIIGRRGHVQASFTIKELRELTRLEDDGYNTAFLVREDELGMCASTPASQEELNGPSGRPKGRIDKLLRDVATKAPNSSLAKQLHLRFLLNPVRFEASAMDPRTLGAVVCERNRLTGDAGKQSVISTGETEVLPAQLALVSIGYKGEALPGTEPWFDTDRGFLRNEHGRVDVRTPQWGALYTAGWIKRGPTGIIGTNIPDAKDTVAAIVADLEDFVPKSTVAATTDLRQLLQDRGVQVVDWHGYRRIDAAERASRRSEAQPREKMLRLHDQLRTAAPETH